MKLNEWKKESSYFLDELRQIDFGFSIGENVMYAGIPMDSTFEILKKLGLNNFTGLVEFYSICNGLSWPDVNCGYFMKSAESLHIVKDEYQPMSIRGVIEGDIVEIGSTGAGDLFAISKKNGDILFLPTGRIQNNIYYDEDSRVRIISSDIEVFLEVLLRDLKAFVNDEADYQYLTS